MVLKYDFIVAQSKSFLVCWQHKSGLFFYIFLKFCELPNFLRLFSCAFSDTLPHTLSQRRGSDEIGAEGTVGGAGRTGCRGGAALYPGVGAAGKGGRVGGRGDGDGGPHLRPPRRLPGGHRRGGAVCIAGGSPRGACHAGMGRAPWGRGGGRGAPIPGCWGRWPTSPPKRGRKGFRIRRG